MATTSELQARLDAIETAIAAGALSVTHDGKKVDYRSLDEMERIAARIRSQIGSQTPVSRYVLHSTKGLD